MLSVKPIAKSCCYSQLQMSKSLVLQNRKRIKESIEPCRTLALTRKGFDSCLQTIRVVIQSVIKAQIYCTMVGLRLWIWTGGFVGHVTWHVIVGLIYMWVCRLARERHHTSVANTPTSTNNLFDPWLQTLLVQFWLMPSTIGSL